MNIANERYRLHLGDCLEVMKGMPDNSVDSIVTDPPYGLSFMGKQWDYDVPNVAIWEECWRVLKPGGHLMAFAGTRTQHRMAVRIEDAGFEIRDMIAWVYGSGFPKSLDVSKAIDKVRDWSKVERLSAEIKRARYAAGLSLKQIGEAMQTATNGQYGYWYHRGGHMFFETGRSLPSRPEWDHLRHVLPITPEFQDAYDEAEREVLKTETRYNEPSGIVAAGREQRTLFERKITAPATDAARQWQGWGTAIKPALEPITLARKPLKGTVAANVLEYGTGALNIDATRLECSRWPANLIHDGELPADLLGEAARFFYCAKTSKQDRDHGNIHPTVKPTDLMAYLCRLVTPPGGIVLDPFMGSGSTGKAAMREGFHFYGIEMDAGYFEIASDRILAARNDARPE